MLAAPTVLVVLALAVPTEGRPGDPPVAGAFLAVRRRRDGSTEPVVETAFPFRRPPG